MKRRDYGKETAEACFRLRVLLDEAVKDNLAEGVLLSGGLDTSVIALLAKSYVKRLRAFTVTLEGYDEDLKYAQKVARFLDLDHKVHFFTEREAWEGFSEARGILGSEEDRGDSFVEPVGPTTFVPTCLALKFAESYVDSVYVGDGADELFIGYPAMIGLVDLILASDEEDDIFGLGFRRRLEKELASVLETCDVFYPRRLGEALGLEVKQPYLTSEVIQHALQIPLEYRVRSEKGKTWGKWILRKAFEEYLPPDVIWRDKRTIDFGTGASKLSDLLRP